MDVYQTPFLDHNSKFLILTKNIDQQFQRELKFFLHQQMSILNFVIVFEKFDEVYVDFNGNPSQPLKFDKLNDFVQEIFPDQLKNLVGHRHSILVMEEPPRVTLENGSPRTKYNYFFKAIQSIEGSKASYKIISGELKYVRDGIVNWFEERQFEIMINIIFALNTAAPKLMTYEEHGFCVFVPNAEVTSFAGEIFLLVNFIFFNSS